MILQPAQHSLLLSK